MPPKKARRKAKPVRKAKTAKKRVARRRTSRRVTAAKPAGPQYNCVLCGVEVAVTKSGLGISRLMCCGQPMTRK